MLKNIFSYIEWPQKYDGTSLKMDILAGLTVALVLIPQSMAYAELAGLPPYYGLYASFLPPMIAALFGDLIVLPVLLYFLKPFGKNVKPA